MAAWRREIQRIEDQSFLTLAKQLAETQTVEGLKGGMAQLVLVAQNRPRRIEAQTLLAQWTKRIEVIQDQPFLDEAIALAKQGKLSAAIEKASAIKSGRTLYAKAQDNLYQWVSELQVAQDRPILDRASELASQGSLGAAIDTASQIGYGRALYSEAAGAIGRWSAELRANSAPPPEPARDYAPAPAQEYAPAPRQEEYAPAPAQEYAPAPRQEDYAPAPEPYYPPARQRPRLPSRNLTIRPRGSRNLTIRPQGNRNLTIRPQGSRNLTIRPQGSRNLTIRPRDRGPAPAPEPPPPAPAPEPAPPSIPESAGPPDANLLPE